MTFQHLLKKISKTNRFSFLSDRSCNRCFSKSFNFWSSSFRCFFNWHLRKFSEIFRVFITRIKFCSFNIKFTNRIIWFFLLLLFVVLLLFVMLLFIVLLNKSMLFSIDFNSFFFKSFFLGFFGGFFFSFFLLISFDLVYQLFFIWFWIFVFFFFLQFFKSFYRVIRGFFWGRCRFGIFFCFRFISFLFTGVLSFWFLSFRVIFILRIRMIFWFVFFDDVVFLALDEGSFTLNLNFFLLNFFFCWIDNFFFLSLFFGFNCSNFLLLKIFFLLFFLSSKLLFVLNSFSFLFF